MRFFILMIIAVISITFGQPILSNGPRMGQVSQKQISDSSQIFADRIVESKIPVLVDFWAPWCGPCRMLSPTIEELKKEYSGKIAVMKINVDVHRALASYFRISSIPAVFLLANKAVVEYLPGFQPKESYKRAIEKTLASSKKSSGAESKDTAAKPQPSVKASPAPKTTPMTEDE